MGKQSRQHLVHYLAETLSRGVKTDVELGPLNDSAGQLLPFLNREGLLMKTLKTPLLTAQEKKEAFGAILKEIKAPQLFQNFVSILIDRKLGVMLPDTLSYFQRLVLTRQQKVHVEIASASPLPDRIKNEISGWAAAFTKLDVILSEKMNPELLGGFQIVLQDKLMDLSLKTRLSALEHVLKGNYA